MNAAYLTLEGPAAEFPHDVCTGCSWCLRPQITVVSGSQPPMPIAVARIHSELTATSSMARASGQTRRSRESAAREPGDSVQVSRLFGTVPSVARRLQSSRCVVWLSFLWSGRRPSPSLRGRFPLHQDLSRPDRRSRCRPRRRLRCKRRHQLRHHKPPPPPPLQHQRRGLRRPRLPRRRSRPALRHARAFPSRWG